MRITRGFSKYIFPLLTFSLLSQGCMIRGSFKESPASIEFINQPTGVGLLEGNGSVQAKALLESGALASNYSGQAELHLIDPLSSGGRFYRSVTAEFQNGVATFPAFMIDKMSSQYQVQVQSGGLMGTSQKFPVTTSSFGYGAGTGTFHDHQIRGSYLYSCFVQRGLMVFDVSQANQPRVVAAYDVYEKMSGTGNMCYGVYIDGNYLYLSMGTSGLFILDITDPKAPVFLNRLYASSSSDTVYKAFVKNGYLYLITDDGLYVYSNQNPSSPTYVNFIADPYSTVDTLRIKGEYAYFVSNASAALYVYNLSNPTTPTRSLVGIGGTGCYEFEIYGDYAYMPTGGSLVIVSLASPSSPVVVNTITPGGMTFYGIEIVGNKAILSNASNGYRTYDLSNLTNPSQTGSFVATANNYRKTISNGSYLYTMDPNLGLLIHNVSDPNNIVFYARSSLGGGPLGSAGVVKNGYLYIMDGFYFSVYDYSSPSFPKLLGSSYNSPPISGGDIEVIGNYAYAAGGSVYLKVFDISNPSNPQLVTTLNPGSSVKGIAVKDKNLFVVDGSLTLYSISVSNPSAPSTLSSISVSAVHTANQIQISGNYGFVANGLGGMAVVNLANPSSMSVVTSLPTTGVVLDIQVQGNYAYLAAGVQGLLIVDISNPTSPSTVGTLAPTTSITEVDVSGNYAYVNDNGTIRVVNISNPSSPTVVTSLTSKLSGVSFIRMRLLDSEYLYARENNRGFSIFNVKDPSAPHQNR